MGGRVFVEPRGDEPTRVAPPTGGSELGLDQTLRVPQSAMTLSEFVDNMFVPECVAVKRPPGRTHYRAILKHVLKPEQVDRIFQLDVRAPNRKLKDVPNWPYLGDMRLCDARPEHVQRLISAAVERGYSVQTVKHIRSVVSVIYSHARRRHLFTGDNPASLVTLPAMTRKEARALTRAQMSDLLGAMQYPEREMALIAILTNMNMEEICGLQWKFVNLSDTWSCVDGEPIPPRMIAVRRQCYRSRLSSVTRKSRNRNLPVPNSLFRLLLGQSRRTKFTGPDDFVLASQTGKPIDQKTIARRRLKTIGRDRQMPWLSWRVFKHTRTSLLDELEIQFDELIMRQPESDLPVNEPGKQNASSASAWTDLVWVPI